MKAFEAAARHESFVVAADELRVTHGAVSRHVGELEKLLGEPLFTRTGRGVKLTAVGAKLGQQLTPLFDKLENATRRFPNKRGRARLRLSCEQSFATLWLAPRVSSFTQTNPDIELGRELINRHGQIMSGCLLPGRKQPLFVVIAMSTKGHDQTLGLAKKCGTLRAAGRRRREYLLNTSGRL